MRGRLLETLMSERLTDKSFQSEFCQFLNKYGVEYDEQYVWGEAYPAAFQALRLLVYREHRPIGLR